MKITAIGRGSAFAPISIGNSNFLFEENGKFMVFDFGTTAPYILRDEMGFDLGDIDAVYLTHAHGDHIGGIEFLSFYRYFIPNKTGQTVRPKLFVYSDFIQPLWCQSLKGGLDGHHGKTMGLTDYYECNPIKKNKHFIWQGIQFQPFETLHINCGFMQKDSYGLFISNPKTGKRGMITGDTVFNPYGLNYLYATSDIIFHDCETYETRSNVHANIADLKTLDPIIKSKMWLYHYGEKVDAPGFAGFVEKGQVFEI
jgi:ribonuclease BN (tRNA processing enzyme)